MKEAIINLLKVKSLVTIITTIVFAYLAIAGRITGEQFLMIFTTIIAFYYGTQSAKSESATPTTAETVAEPEETITADEVESNE